MKTRSTEYLRFKTRNGESEVGKPRVFVCYRQMDSFYMERIVRDILHDDHGIDCAVWYDAYLTGGKEYDTEIRRAINQSDLCVIVITKNTFEEGNYVIDTEIPYMIENHKQLLPIIAADIDVRSAEKALMNAGLPKGINILTLNERRYTETLRDRLSRILLNTDENSMIESALLLEGSGRTTPDDDFWIGMAYLYGKGERQRDVEKALGLITAAAQRDSALAMEELAVMYHTGAEVPMDFGKAREWQIKYIESIDRRIAMDFPEGEIVPYDTLLRKYNAVKRLGQIYCDLREIENMRETYQKQLDIAVALGEQTSDIFALQLKADCAYNLGSVLYQERKLEEADRYLASALEDCRQLYSGSKDNDAKHSEAARLLVSIHFDYGRLLEKQYLLDEAEDSYLQGIKLLKKTARAINGTPAKIITSGFLRHLGDVFMKKGDLLRAEEYYSQDLALCEKILQSEKSLTTYTHYINATYSMAVSLFEKGRLHDARKKLEKALEDAEYICREYDTPDSLRLLAKVHGSLGDVLRAKGRLDEAKEHYENDIKSMEALVERASTVQYRRDCGLAYKLFSELCIEINELGMANSYLNKAHEHFAKIQNDTDTRESLLDLAQCEHDFGVLRDIQGSVSKSEDHHKRALELQSAAVERSRTPNSLMALCKTYGRLANIRLSRGDFDNALEYAKKDHEICTELSSNTSMLSCRRMLVGSHGLLGSIYRKTGKIDTAENEYLSAVRVAEEIWISATTNRSCEDLAQAKATLVDFYLFTGNLEGAEKHALDAINRRKDVNSTANSYKSKTLLAKSYMQLGSVRKYQYDMLSAQKSVMNAISLYDSFDEYTRKSHDALRNITEAYGTMTRIMLEQNNLDEAYRYADLDHTTSKQLYNLYDVPSSVKTYCVSLSMLSKVLIRMGDDRKALRYLNESLDLRKKRLSSADSLINQYPMSKSFVDLGDYYRRTGEPEKAKTYYEDALNIRQRIYEEFHTTKSINKFAEVYHCLGELALSQNQPELAIEYFEKDRELLKQLCDKTPMPQYACYYAVALNHLGDAYRHKGDSDTAKKFYKDSLDALMNIEPEKQIVKVKLALVDCMADLGDMLLNSKPKESEDLYLQACEQAEIFNGQALTKEIADKLLRIYGSMEKLRREQGDISSAELYKARIAHINDSLENSRSNALELIKNIGTVTEHSRRRHKKSKARRRRNRKLRNNASSNPMVTSMRRMKTAIGVLSVLLAGMGAAIVYLILMLQK
ncbi:MAG: tetratricopeptide repeat protein [Ruminococcaceae bacterium]|nr:tetratricopeptide repeat protein [Oscillospiraceae bacterium]